MSADFIARIIGMVVFAIGGGYGGVALSELLSQSPQLYGVIFILVGALAGLVLTPYLSTRPVRAIRAQLAQLQAEKLVSGQLGLLSGLIIAALLTLPLSRLPRPFGDILPFLGVLLFGYLGVAIFILRSHDIFSIISGRLIGHAGDGGAEDGSLEQRPILMDTSVIIDGRIADIARTGFLTGTLIIPRFILNELQYIADSPDSMRRQRGRRGMEIISQLQKVSTMLVRISDMDVEGVHEVDDKLVILARQLRCPILTNDYNLNRVAELQGVPVLNVNELANAVKSVLLPGEALSVKIIQEGKESGQGVGYLDDGTMVVVEAGRNMLMEETSVIVTKVLQTAAGRMIFARPENSN